MKNTGIVTIDMEDPYVKILFKQQEKQSKAQSLAKDQFLSDPSENISDTQSAEHYKHKAVKSKEIEKIDAKIQRLTG